MMIILPKYFCIGMEDNKADFTTHFFTPKFNHIMFCKTTQVTSYITNRDETDINGLLSMSFSGSSKHFEVGVTKCDNPQRYLWGHNNTKRFDGYTPAV